MALVDKIPGVAQFNDYLKGAPNNVLTFGLLGVAIFAVLMALAGPPVLKATILAWLVLP